MNEYYLQELLDIDCNFLAINFECEKMRKNEVSVKQINPLR